MRVICNKNSMRIFFEEIYVELLQFNGNIDIFSLYISNGLEYTLFTKMKRVIMTVI